MSINSDEVSEKYRRYIIEVFYSSKERYYLLWGTDLTNEDFDFLMLNQSGQILAFSRISLLLNYVKNEGTIINKEATMLWVKHYKNRSAYTTYYIDSIYSLLDVQFSLNALEEKDAECFVDFFNLFCDYAHQAGDEMFIKMTKRKSILVLVDFFHAKFFWNSRGREKRIENLASKFDFMKFKMDYMKIVDSFKQKLLVGK